MNQAMKSRASDRSASPKLFGDAPCVVFTATLAVISGVLFILSYIVMNFPLMDPHIKDWNIFLGRFGKLHLCLGPPSPNDPLVKDVLGSKFKDFLGDSNKANSSFVVSSLRLQFHVKDAEWFSRQNASQFYLAFRLSSDLLGTAGETGSVDVRFRVSMYQVLRSCKLNGDKYSCTDDIPVATCVHFSGPSALLPKQTHPDACLQDPLDDLNLNGGATPNGMHPSVLVDLPQRSWLWNLAGSEASESNKDSSGAPSCSTSHSGSLLTAAQFDFDRDLDASIPESHRRVISSRLVFAALVLLVIVTFLFFSSQFATTIAAFASTSPSPIRPASSESTASLVRRFDD